MKVLCDRISNYVYIMANGADVSVNSRRVHPRKLVERTNMMLQSLCLAADLLNNFVIIY